LYEEIDGESIRFCHLNDIICPYFGDRTKCGAYKEIRKRYEIYKKIHELEKIGGLEKIT